MCSLSALLVRVYCVCSACVLRVAACVLRVFCVCSACGCVCTACGAAWGCVRLRGAAC